MPKLHYAGHELQIGERTAEDLAERVLELANAGRFEWFEYGNRIAPTRLLIGPGIPVLIEPY